MSQYLRIPIPDEQFLEYCRSAANWLRSLREDQVPRATVNINHTERKDLKSLPPTDGEEGGYVVLRRMSWGEKLRRQAMAAKMKVSTGKGRDFEGEMALANEAVAHFEFSNCIVEHNLEDENGNLLDMRSPTSVSMLDGKVGDEINLYIEQMNNFEEDEGNS